MTNEQKQKVLQLLELCIDNSEAGVIECTFDTFPSNYGSVTVNVYLGGDRSKFAETHSLALNLPGGNTKLDLAIEAVRTLPERAPDIIKAKRAKYKANTEREYSKLFEKSPL